MVVYAVAAALRGCGRGHGDRRDLLGNRDNRDHGRDSREPRDCREEPGGKMNDGLVGD